MDLTQSILCSEATIIVPTICTEDQLDTLKRTLSSINSTISYAIIVVTPKDRRNIVKRMAKKGDRKIRVIGNREEEESNGQQKWLGIAKVRTEIISLIDDDVEWHTGKNFFPLTLVSLKDNGMRKAKADGPVERNHYWNSTKCCGSIYMARQNHWSITTHAIHPTSSHFSRRKLEIRTSIFQALELEEQYLGKKCCGHELDADDRNSTTHWGDEKGNVQTQPESAVLGHSMKQMHPQVLSASGNTLHLNNGSSVYDGSCGAAVSCLGHAHIPRIFEAMRIEELLCSYHPDRSFSAPAVESYAMALLKTTKEIMRQVYICNSGSDAVESAMKLSWQYHRDKGRPRSRFISRQQSYHGGTLGALALSGIKSRREPFEGLLTDKVSHISACNPYRDRREGQSDEEYVKMKADELDAEFKRVGPEQVVAFVVEPVVGAALGCTPAVPGYLQAIKDVCHKHGALLIFDEVMCGFGRTGTFHAWEHDNVTPDIQLIGKGVAAGVMPVAAMLCSHHVYETIRKGSGFFRHRFTFQNQPIPCAAAHEALNIVQEKRLVDRVARLAPLLEAKLHEKLGSHPNVGNIRGRGFFWGIEFVKDKATKAPFDSRLCVNERIHKTAMEEFKVYTYPGGGTVDGVHGDHVIVAPPFDISEKEMDHLVDGVSMAIRTVFAELESRPLLPPPPPTPFPSPNSEQ